MSDNITSDDYSVSTVDTTSVDEQQVDEYNNIERNVNKIETTSKENSITSLNNGGIHTINNDTWKTFLSVKV